MADLILLGNGPIANHLSGEIKLRKRDDLHLVVLLQESSVQFFDEKIHQPFDGKLLPILNAQKPKHITLVGDLRWLIQPGPNMDDDEAQGDTIGYWRDGGPSSLAGSRNRDIVSDAVAKLWYQWSIQSPLHIRAKHPAQLLFELNQEDWRVAEGFITGKEVFRAPNGLSPEDYVATLIDKTVEYLSVAPNRSIRQSIAFDGLTRLDDQPFLGTEALLEHLAQLPEVRGARAIVKLRPPHLPTGWDPPALGVHIIKNAQRAGIKLIVIDSEGLIEDPETFKAQALDAGIAVYGFNSEHLTLERGE